MKKEYGFGIVELMISILIGLILLLGVTNIFISNFKSFQTLENLARMQENARFAFESMSYDLREAGGNPCGTGIIAMANTLDVGGSGYSDAYDWASGVIRGYESSDTAPGIAVGSGFGDRVPGTDAVSTMRGDSEGAVKVTGHNAPSAVIDVTTNSPFVNNQIVMMCDNDTSAIFQITALPSGLKIQHNSGAGSPGNCSKGLGFPTDCSGALGNQKEFTSGMVTSFSSSLWYIGNNMRNGGKSLFLSKNGTAGVEIVEMIDGVSGMQIQYLTKNMTTKVLANDYVDATSITSWNNTANDVVIALSIVFTVESGSESGLSTDGTANQKMTRTVQNVISLKNRELLQ